ncbi:MAG: hypothetical protein Ta2A_11600 [Treponemataceae bacterium]|nr:MAG: hypothetical protein Ta2A_11600 [Treponemataceae bacterium]
MYPSMSEWIDESVYNNSSSDASVVLPRESKVWDGEVEKTPLSYSYLRNIKEQVSKFANILQFVCGRDDVTCELCTENKYCKQVAVNIDAVLFAQGVNKE